MTKRKITYYWGDRNVVIDLGNHIDLRIRALYIAEFIVTAGMATVFLLQSLPLKNNFFHWAACIGASVLYLLAAYRLISRLFYTERLQLDPATFTIIRRSLFSQQIKQYEWRSIGVLHYEGAGRKTDHPLKGKCYDYFGFETQEHLIQSLHHGGTMYFETAKGKIYFAPGVYSWNAEEMVQMMKLYIGSSLKLGPEWEEMLQEQEFDDA